MGLTRDSAELTSVPFAVRTSVRVLTRYEKYPLASANGDMVECIWSRDTKPVSGSAAFVKSTISDSKPGNSIEGSPCGFGEIAGLPGCSDTAGETVVVVTEEDPLVVVVVAEDDPLVVDGAIVVGITLSPTGR
ncbi:MAG: hypothetical protein ACC683_07410 [Acidimicrobiia bacterium]